MDESQIFSNQRGRLPKQKSLKLAKNILKKERKQLPVNIIFSDDKYLAYLNRKFRDKNGATDVLSFPADPELEILGEVYISVDTARRQANENRILVSEEILHLVCHGLLHLCGYNHHKESDAKIMAQTEKRFMSGITKI